MNMNELQKALLSKQPSPKQNLTFNRYMQHCIDMGIVLDRDFEDALNFKLPSGEYNMLAYLYADCAPD